MELGAVSRADREGYAFIADLYDQVGPYRDRPDIPFYVDAAVRAGGPVLELGCGTGRVLIPTARAGVDVVGLDSSPAMLAECRTRLENEPESVRSAVDLVGADMREFRLSGRFALATLPFRPFQHLITIEDQLCCLGAIRAHLVDGGRVILDVFNPSLESLTNRPAGKEFGDEPEFVMLDGRRVVRTHRITAHDRFAQVNHVELIYRITYPDGRDERIVDAFTMRYFFRYEMEHLLARAGFEVEAVNSGFDGSPYGSQYPGELVFTARKTS